MSLNENNTSLRFLWKPEMFSNHNENITDFAIRLIDFAFQESWNVSVWNFEWFKFILNLDIDNLDTFSNRIESEYSAYLDKKNEFNKEILLNVLDIHSSVEWVNCPHFDK